MPFLLKHQQLPRANMMTIRRKKRLVLIAAALVVVCGTSPFAGENWPRWRGPRGDGHSTETNVPVRWSAESIEWKAPLPGIGQSSPIIWGDRIFLTSARDKGRERIVCCVDGRDGKVLWEHVAWTGEPEKIHDMNSWASASCATDGEIVVASFGKGGLHAYTIEGQHRWSRDLGPFEGPWGTAACPIIVGGLVVQNGDADENAFVMGLDKQSGETVWTTPRFNSRGWSTPILVEAGGRTEMVLNGHNGVTAYEPATGKELWFCKSFNGRGEPTITPAGDLLCAVNGLAGDIYAIRPGGKGDVTSTRMAWHTPRNGGRDTPSPIVIDGYIVVADMKGVAACYDSKSGKELWKQRICNAIASSPIAVAGLAYFQDEQGETVVFKPGPKFDVVARNSLGTIGGEIFRASLAPVNGKMYSRSNQALYRISADKTAGQ
jgi:outer membrane protein assembly factor BamB